MNPEKQVYLPTRLGAAGKIANNTILQVDRPAAIELCQVQEVVSGRAKGSLLHLKSGEKVYIFPRNLRSIPAEISGLLVHPELPTEDVPGVWKAPALVNLAVQTASERIKRCEEARDSWKGQFNFLEEERDGSGEIIKLGLRPPQLGALFAVLSHWKVGIRPATVVMPTGTGKTEVMLTLLVSQRLSKLLVIVPTTQLRDQIFEKFTSLGILKQFGIVGPGGKLPVVGKLEHRPKSPEEVKQYFQSCNVVVTNIGVVGGCLAEVQEAIAEECSHLFIDEAHHIPAPTWTQFRHSFTVKQKPIVQFTATPFRTDGKSVDGKIVFNYPLGLAQEEGYFKQINFIELWAFEDQDLEIARAAKKQLEEDIAKGLNHMVMARADSINRAVAIHELYTQEMPEHNPLLIYGSLPKGEKRAVLSQLKKGTSKVIVCVDMLGEGYDLPELKIAALHDAHKSLAITLQFTGRFTRVKGESIGEATMIANIANTNMESSLQALYAENADWNKIIRRLGEGATGQQEEKSEFTEGFVTLPPEVPLQTILPKMSTVVYQTACSDWTPDGVKNVIKEEAFYTELSVNNSHKVMWFVTRESEEVPWANFKELRNNSWHLYLLHWDESRKLLFINSSNKDSAHEAIAKEVAGDSAALIRGSRVFRTMHGIQRFVPTIVGLKHMLSRNVLFTMLAGSDVGDGFDPERARNKTKSNVFGRGYENGSKASMGCSQKGRIWSHLIAGNLLEWVAWCHHIGTKLIDETIDLEQMFKGFLIPKRLTERPQLVPLAIDWPAEFWLRGEDSINIQIGSTGQPVPFYEMSLALSEHSESEPIRFRVVGDSEYAEYELVFGEDGTRYVAKTPEAQITVGKRTRPLSEWFHNEPPKIYLSGDSYIENDELISLERAVEPFPTDAVETLDWSGIDIKKESQGVERSRDTIQYRTIESIDKADWDVIFDDDNAYEAADVIALSMSGDRLKVGFYHCKFSGDATPGSRVDDLYALCGQAQKSIRWREDVERLIKHMVMREKSRRQKAQATRFEHGDMQALARIQKKLNWLTPEFEIILVQPGLSKVALAANQMELLAATRMYLTETYNIPLRVIGSA